MVIILHPQDDSALFAVSVVPPTFAKRAGYEEENCEEGDEYASMLRYENIAAVVTQ
eukprot:CAMPEP_0169296156 /NCGR_PEP_ID=MMETSP1016-20121227/64976_1 /TAXON_ID=342587 /ORGANISM="Karlodinium micrum, Strain CCMP2283" /LENGTH=55 /DNA_ID=CAMNT_0009387501 /DNA_START=177 /DNA_END=342 /DNA_ORIENTATION=-